MDIFGIERFDYKQRKRNLGSKASGVVSSTKFFPVFEMNGKEKIFKPLSKTKPLSTPLFSYSEVYWSYLINKYIDSKTPLYTLAYCSNLSIEQPKYYEKGCIVDNILNEGEELINLLEFFRMYPDSIVNIDDYVNYCEVQYDYTQILTSTFFKSNEKFGKKLAQQILCAILRRDENYHYENVSLIFKDGKPKDIAPIIDLEFSQMFMYPDVKDFHEGKFSLYDEGMMPIFTYDPSKSYEENAKKFLQKINNGSVYDRFDRYQNYLVMRNIKTIVDLYPDVAQEFIYKLNGMLEEVNSLEIDFNSDFLGTFSSHDWEPTRMLLKEGKSEEDSEYIRAKKNAEDNRIVLDTNVFNKRLKKEIIWHINKLINTIMFFLTIKNNQLPNIKQYENKTLYAKVNRYPENMMEIFAQTIEDTMGSKQKEKK